MYHYKQSCEVAIGYFGTEHANTQRKLRDLAQVVMMISPHQQRLAQIILQGRVDVLQPRPNAEERRYYDPELTAHSRYDVPSQQQALQQLGAGGWNPLLGADSSDSDDSDDPY